MWRLFSQPWDHMEHYAGMRVSAQVHTCTHTFTCSHTHPLPLLSHPSSGESLWATFSSLMETLILAVWKRVSRADSSGDPLTGLARR